MSRQLGCVVAACLLLVTLGGAACRKARTQAETEAQALAQGFLPSDFRAHVEFVTEGAVDWGNHRYLARVSVPVVDKTTSGETLSPIVAEARAYDAAGLAASRVFLTLASGIRVDAHDTLSNLASDEGTLRILGNVQGRRLLRKRRLRNGDLECLFEVPMLGVGGVVSKLYPRAARSASDSGHIEPYEASLGREHRWALSSQTACTHLPAGSCVASGVLAGAIGEDWDLAWTVERPKDAIFTPVLAGKAALAASPSERAPAAAPRAGAYEAADRADSFRPEEPAPAIVIDARGTGVRAALFPTILDESGRVIYGASRARREAVINEGLAQYVELTSANSSMGAPWQLATGRATPHFAVFLGLPDGGGEQPTAAEPKPRRRRVVLTAKASEGPLRANIILSKQDAARFLAEQKAIEEARVIVVTDTSIGGVEGMLPQAELLALR